MVRIVFLLLLIVWTRAAIAQQTFTLVFLNKKTNAEVLEKTEHDKLMAAHMANIERLAKEGHLLAAGPFDGGGGIFIFKSPNKQEVETLIQSDPAVRANRWQIEILPYTPVIGGICPVGETYEMTTYQFIRFSPNRYKVNEAQMPRIVKEQEAYWKEQHAKSSLITFSLLAQDAGNIVLVAQPLDEKIISSDPGVKQGYYSIETKRLYIAKGSFCESK